MQVVPHTKLGHVSISDILCRGHVFNASIAVILRDTDEVYAGFLSACAKAGPAACAIAESGSTADSIKAWIQKLMDAAYYSKKAGGPLGSADIRSECAFFSHLPLGAESDIQRVGTIFQGMYTPIQWSTLASNIYDMANVIFGNATSKAPRDLLERVPGPSEILRNTRRSANQKLNDFALQAITCADAIDSGDTTTKDVFDEIIHASQAVSEMCTFLLF